MRKERGLALEHDLKTNLLAHSPSLLFAIGIGAVACHSSSDSASHASANGGGAGVSGGTSGGATSGGGEVGSDAGAGADNGGAGNSAGNDAAGANGEAGAAGLSEAGAGNEAGASGDTGPAVTAVGAIADDAIQAFATIGAAGGTLSADGGRVTLTVPAGALTSNTKLRITPIDNTAPGGTGHAYRLEPNRQTFAKPVTLMLTASPDDVEGSELSQLGAAYQDSAGHWLDIAVKTDEQASTVQFETPHFTDFSFYERSQLVGLPTGTVAFLKSSVLLKAVEIPKDNGMLGFGVPITPELGIDWAVNGASGGDAAHGQIKPVTASSASYSAPASFPSDGDPIVSASFKAGASPLFLTANLRLLAHGYAVTVANANKGLCDNGSGQGGEIMTWTMDMSDTIHMTLDSVFTVHSGASDPPATPEIIGGLPCNAQCPTHVVTGTPPLTVTHISGGFDIKRNKLKLPIQGGFADVPKYLDCNGHTGGGDLNPWDPWAPFLLFTGYPGTFHVSQSASDAGIRDDITFTFVVEQP